MNELPSPVYDRERMADLWLAGYSMAGVARELGCSRERVRQLVANGSLPPRERWVNPGGLGARLLKRGLIVASPDGLIRWADLDAARIRLQTRGCEWPDCSASIGTVNLRQRFCAEHTKENYRYRYPGLSLPQRGRQIAAALRWQRKHPALAQLIHQRASLVSRLVHRYGFAREVAREVANIRFPLPQRQGTQPSSISSEPQVLGPLLSSVPDSGTVA